MCVCVCVCVCVCTYMYMYLIAPAKALLELQDESLSQQLPSLRELGVDDGYESSIDVGEGGRGGLGLDH